jgi:ATP-binding cassette subfamily B (MDR/TAP) protein 1
LSQLSPALKKIGEGQQSAARIFEILDREPKIINPVNGLRPATFTGHIKFENVTFSYPKDKSRTILNNLSIEFHVNNTALVGESGCGKSTILQLIMRFYDPDQGRVLLDGNDLKLLDLNWLRNQIGYVGQEPVLFATTIRENLKLGYEGASEEEIKNALHQA